MTKSELIEKILDHMAEMNNGRRAEVEGRWKAWLRRQTKEMLETIYQNRIATEK